MEKLKKIGVIAIRFAIAITIAYFIFKRLGTSWREVADSFAAAHYPTMILGMFIIMVSFLIPAVAWRKILEEGYGVRIPYFQALILLFLPVLAKYIPGKVWFVAILAYLAKKYNINSMTAFTSVILLQACLLIASLILGLLLCDYGQGLLLSQWGAIFIAFIVLFIVNPNILNFIIYNFLRIFRPSKRYEFPTLSGWRIIFTISMYLAGKTMVGFGIAVAAASIYGNSMISLFREITGAFTLAYFLGYISFFVPAGLGIREGAMAVLLPSSMTATQKSVISIGSRLWITIAELAFYVFIVILYRAKRKDFVNAEEK